MLTSSVFLETSILNIPSITVYPSISSLQHELRFEQPCTQDLRSCASQDTVQSEQRSLEKRGLIYRTGSFAKGTQEAHRSPRSQQICLFAKQSATYKGRVFHHAPPAQNRTCDFPAYGSHLGCVTAKRSLGQGCRMLGFGSQSFASCVIRAQVIRSFWLRRRSVRRHKSITWCRNTCSARALVGTA